MTDYFIIAGILVGSLVALWLSYFIYTQVMHIRHSKLRHQENEQKLQRLYEEKLDSVASSLKVICQALIEKQVGLVEASIRIKHLLEQVDLAIQKDPEINVFFEVYDQTQHIPILEKWKSLDKLAKHKYRLQIEEIETNLEKEASAAARHMLRALLI